MKKAQITLFVIVGILLLFMVALVIFVADLDITTTTTGEFDTLQNTIQQCVEQTSFAALETIGGNGGYQIVPPVLAAGTTSYWFIDRKNLQPTLGEIDLNLEAYITSQLPRCIPLNQLRNEGIEITDAQIKTNVTIHADKVSVMVTYPFTAKRGSAQQTFDRFGAEFELRFRKMYELASQIINAQLDETFNQTSPLQLVNNSLFRTSFEHINTTLLFTLEETRLYEGRPLQFQFAVERTQSQLPKHIVMQSHSHVLPLPQELTLFSPDHLARVMLDRGTTISLNGKAVPEIIISQLYPSELSSELVPFHELEDNSVIYDVHRWTTPYPVYSFEPTGLLFNRPQQLRVYWDEENIPHTGPMGLLMQHNNITRPIPASINYGEHYADVFIPGFTRFAFVDCGLMDGQEKSATAEIEPPTPQCSLGPAGFIASLYVGAILGGSYTYFAATTVGGGSGYDSADDCITFTPTCDQQLNVSVYLRDGNGECEIFDDSGRLSPHEGHETYSLYNVKAGTTVTMCSVLEGCDASDRLKCKKCKMKCSTVYK